MSAGSSPRARGTDADRPQQAAQRRFIPAGAGNGCGSTAPPCCTPVHPRGRGERPRDVGINPCGCGSSPRARGTGHPSLFQFLPERFIPAGAGNGSPASRNAPGLAVHPRGRGERRARRLQVAVRGGSSPRARGTGQARLALASADRFIPAGAGNGRWDCAGLMTNPVHPRGRGERGPGYTEGDGWAGSSPRARGTDRRSAEGRY